MVSEIDKVLSAIGAIPELIEEVKALRYEVSSMKAAQATPRKIYLTLKEAAGALGQSEKSVRRLVDRGLLRRTKSSRRILIPREDVESFGERTT